MDKESFFGKVEKIKLPVRILILVGTLVILAGLFIWAVYLPKTEEINTTRQEMAGLEQKLNQARIRAKRLAEFRAEEAEVEAQFQEALKLLPDKKEIPSLLRTITQLGSESDLEFRLFQPQNEREQNFYMEIPVSIEVSGTYHNVGVFFDKVGRMDRIVNILNVGMKPVTARSTTLVTKCDAVTYRFKGVTDAGETEKKK